MPLSFRNARTRWIGIGIVQLVAWIVYGILYYTTLRPYNPFIDIVLQQALWATGSGLLIRPAHQFPVGVGLLRIGAIAMAPGMAEPDCDAGICGRGRRLGQRKPLGRHLY